MTATTSWMTDRAWQGARTAGLVLAGSLALALSAKVQVPFWPVPMTMQSLVVVLLGLGYGSRLGAATVIAYLAEGLAGLPVFAGAVAGPAYFTGPTAGYLFGFAAAAGFVGWLAERGWDRPAGWAALALALGHVALFVPGVLWLATLVGWSQAIAAGLAPFVVASVVKIALGTAMASAWHRRPAR